MKLLQLILLQQVQDVEGVASLVDWFETDDNFYLVMEKIGGMDLFDFISTHGSISEPLARIIFSQVHF